MVIVFFRTFSRLSRTPSWGAWIEMEKGKTEKATGKVVPPRGVRGLKSTRGPSWTKEKRRTPSWGAWIEIRAWACSWLHLGRTPSWGAWIEIAIYACV